VVAACSLLPLAYSVFHQAPHRPIRPATGPARPAHEGNSQADATMLLQIMPAPYQLPAAVSREVVLPGANGPLILGGLTPSGASTSAATSLDPVTGASRGAGRLAEATHDAAGLIIGGRMFVLGGGTASSVPTVQAFTQGTQAAVVGQLSRARSDSDGVSAGPVGYVVGGYDGTILDPQVLVRTDGRHFRIAARLPVPVRYAATAAVISLDGRVYVAGGATAHGTSRTVFRFDPATFLVSPAGQLPAPAGYAAAVTSGGIGYLIGGEDGAFFSPDGKYIIATQEDDQVISVISLATSTITYRYGLPGVPGAGPDRLFNPDDAMLTPAGGIVSADIKNCRLVIITPPAHAVTRVIGRTTNACEHAPPRRFGSPNGAFPMTNGHYLVTEINGDWADEMSLGGPRSGSTVSWSANPPGVLYPDGVDLVPPDSLLVTHAATMGQP
jgi:DNA-binding beta-propeller fold protein YncE